MSIDHISKDLPEAHFRWSHYFTQTSPMNSPSTHLTATATAGAMFSGEGYGFGFDFNNEEDKEKPVPDEMEAGYQVPPELMKETLFEKPLTPSDVGKLNRLVIPKQHAEKYFPMVGKEKGLLLGFEDELGKPWRFRYSYWSSSQSYVLTKGWSRFVKEKKLDAGDIVCFARHQADAGRLFIGWRRRSFIGGGDGGVGVWSREVYGGNPYPGDASFPYQPDCRHAGVSVPQIQTNPIPGIPKKVRLFGVNLEWPAEEGEPVQSDSHGYEVRRR